MDDTPTLQRIHEILGCESPWFIRRFSASFEPHKVHVWLDHRNVSWPCPACHRVFPCDGHTRERVFLCLGCDEPEAHVYLRVPCVRCPVHGVQEVRVPWMFDRTRWRYVRTSAASANEDRTIH